MLLECYFKDKFVFQGLKFEIFVRYGVMYIIDDNNFLIFYFFYVNLDQRIVGMRIMFFQYVVKFLEQDSVVGREEGEEGYMFDVVKSF